LFEKNEKLKKNNENKKNIFFSLIGQRSREAEKQRSREAAKQLQNI